METFTDDQIASAIIQFLEYGEKQLGKSHRGYFSGDGWAARCLRFERDRLLGQRSDEHNSTWQRIESRLREIANMRWCE